MKNFNYKKNLNQRIVPVVVASFGLIVFYFSRYKFLDIIATLMISGSMFFIFQEIYKKDNIDLEDKTHEIEEFILEQGTEFKNQNELDAFLKSQKRELDMFKWERKVRRIVILIFASVSLATSIGLIFNL